MPIANCRIHIAASIFLLRATTFGIIEDGRREAEYGTREAKNIFCKLQNHEKCKKIFCKLQNTQREIFAVGDDDWDRGRPTRGGVWDERGRSLDRAFGEGRSNI